MANEDNHVAEKVGAGVGAAAGAGAAIAGAGAAVTAAGTAAGVTGAAAVTTGLATIGGSLLGGIAMVAAAPVAAAVGFGYGIAKSVKNKKKL